MSRGKIFGVWSIVVTGFSMMAVANSASATLWLKTGASISTETAATGHGSGVFHHKGGLSGTFSLECTGSVIGTVGPEALGLVTKLEGPKKEINAESCTFLEGGNCANAGETVIVHALGLPWHALLELISGKTWNSVLSESGKEPGAEFGCPKIFGFKGTCKRELLSEFQKNGTNGAIFESFGTSTAACSDGGEGTLLSLGEALGVTVS